MPAKINDMSNKPFISPAEDPGIFREVRDFLQKTTDPDAPAIETLTPGAARKVLSNLQVSVTVDHSGIDESESLVLQDEVPVNVHIIKPEGYTGLLPVFLFIHGGGWVLGDYPTHRRLVRDIVVHSGAAAIFPDYSPSPEARYPVAINQIYNLAKWIAEKGSEVGVDGKKLAIVGNSVGGNMSTVITLMAKDRQGPDIKCQALLWPVTDADFETDSYRLFAEGRFLTKDMMKWFWGNYIENQRDRKHKYASPLQASLSELAGLPPALIQTAENDVLRDEAEAYARKLDAAGVEVTLTRYQGMIHDFGMLNPLATLPATKAAVSQIAGFLKEKLFK